MDRNICQRLGLENKLQSLLTAAGDTANILGLTFRPDKFASINLTYGRRGDNNIQPTQYNIQGNPMPALKEHDHYHYLGVPIGMLRDAHSIDGTNLYRLRMQ